MKYVDGEWIQLSEIFPFGDCRHFAMAHYENITYTSCHDIENDDKTDVNYIVE